MKFNMRSFVMKGLLSAIGVQSDYWVILESAKWYEKGILHDEDLEEINRKIDEKNAEIEHRKEEEQQEQENVQNETEESTSNFEEL